MNLISLFFASMRVASKIDHAPRHMNAGDAEELINALCMTDPVDRVAILSPAEDVAIDESLQHAA
ncbi:MAG: hypothetical protein IMF08_15160 [Proteobacteria bacterium]|nr:hypothetical protein [Pseudomonadota bacterium]